MTHETESHSGGSGAARYRTRHVIVGFGADLIDVAEKARSGYAGPIGPDYKVLRWEEGEWR